LLALFTLFQSPSQRISSQVIAYSQFLTEVEQSRVREVVIEGSEIYGQFSDGRSALKTFAPNDPGLVPLLKQKNITFSARPHQENLPWFVALIVAWLPAIAYLVLTLVFFQILIRIQRALERLSDREPHKG